MTQTLLFGVARSGSSSHCHGCGLIMSSKQKIPDAVWQAHKEEIHSLYVTQDLSLADVMSHMKEKCGFKAR
jgi:hypothetical protein